MIATNPIARAGAPDLTDDTLVGCWCSPYGNNPWQDVSTSRNDMTPVGGCTVGSVGVELDGTTGYMTRADAGAADPYRFGLGSGTFGAWFKGTDTGGDILSKSAGDGYWALDVTSSTLRCHMQATDGTEFTAVGGLLSGVTPTDGAWYHAMVVLDRTAGLLSIYVNGEFKVSRDISALSAKLVSPSAALYVGKFSGGNFYAGSVADARVYSEAKAATWIRELYKAGVPR